MEDRYRTILSPCEGLFKSKGSKHFGYGFPIQSEEEARLHLQSLRKEHHSARHVAYAWMLGHDGYKHKCSDDGEPTNTAGPPILGVIRSNRLTQVMFAVIRYFGGTKLGVGGLIEAYRNGALEALNNGQIVERIRTQRCRIFFRYEHMGVVMGLIKRWNLEPATTDFQMACTIDVDVRLSLVEDFCKNVLETRVADVNRI